MRCPATSLSRRGLARCPGHAAALPRRRSVSVLAPIRAAAADGAAGSAGEEPTATPAAPQAADRGTAAALGRSLTELSKAANRVGATNLLLVGESEEMWRRLDNKVNKYPMQRSFTVIGTGGDEFRRSMVAAVERVVGSVHTECVSQRHSSKGNYISVTVGPVWVENGDQIIQVYANLKEDPRTKWII